MRIFVNATLNNVSAGSLSEVLNELGYNDAAIATAVNGTFVAKSDRATATISDGDRIEILAPMQGG
ncbi:sulfur carrier protein ThiS [Loktanella sp. S4079]|uniref:sulfur carrier protein ThiS n=1 Tax=Loktanella sp. S4079 TaxID=579483 RepID=UPI0005F9DB79|nr:sulfur carrier protein ThiS [Loktanella sp. S4079]KJZ18004.1 hypothetical protein TW80_16050 [Loktanella sp. S4079]